MGLSGTDVIALAHHLTIAHDHTTHPRVGVGRVTATARQLERAGHVVEIVVLRH